MPSPIIIGLTGFKSAGKDTTYGLIYEQTAPELIVERKGFADNLKLLAGAALGLSVSDEAVLDWANEFKETGQVAWSNFPGGIASHDFDGCTGREFLQNLGLAGRELIGDTFWIDQVLPNPKAIDGWVNAEDLIHNAYPVTDVLVITDVRFENEAARIKTFPNSYIWEVQRPGLESDGHPSEEPLPRKYIDRVIDNSSDIDHLRDEVELALQGVGL